MNLGIVRNFIKYSLKIALMKAGTIEASCGLKFSIISGFVTKFLKTIRNKKKPQ